ncbi:MAG: basic amino acid ABC transporter substrate-binding protein [Candidatus Eisenbacteria bacterium]|nr:basic amino acid ABC transporter substrate-binding protein [Candidatus Eisenbacteria bacterium]
MHRKAALPVVLWLVLSPSLLSCGRPASETTLARIQRTRVLEVGTDATYPPFESIDPATARPAGFDIDLMREVAVRLGAEARFENVPFEGILPALRSGKYDAVISAMTITEERAREVQFSRPYYAAGQSICVAAGSAIETPEELRGKRIGVQLGTTGERTAKTIAEASVVSFDAIGAAFLDLRNGHLDAVIADTPTARLFASDHPDIRLTGEPITRESYGIAMRKTDPDLAAAIDAALEAMEREGKIAALREAWKLPAP